MDESKSFFRRASIFWRKQIGINIDKRRGATTKQRSWHQRKKKWKNTSEEAEWSKKNGEREGREGGGAGPEFVTRITSKPLSYRRCMQEQKIRNDSSNTERRSESAILANCANRAFGYDGAHRFSRSETLRRGKPPPARGPPINRALGLSRGRKRTAGPAFAAAYAARETGACIDGSGAEAD